MYNIILCIDDKSKISEILVNKFKKNKKFKILKICNSINDIININNREKNIFILIDFPYLIPKNLLESNIFINCHGSLLPDYRGHHATGWAFINMNEYIGYTIHLVEEKFDSGKILYQDKFKINKNETFNTLKNKIILSIQKNYDKVVLSFMDGKIKPKIQKSKFPIYVTKRNLRDCYIEWDNSAKYIENFIRSVSFPSAPGAFTIYKNQKIIIHKVEIYNSQDYIETPGHILLIDEKGVLVKVKDKAVWIIEVIIENKIRMANEIFNTIGQRLGIDLINEKLIQLGIK